MIHNIYHGSIMKFKAVGVNFLFYVKHISCTNQLDQERNSAESTFMPLLKLIQGII